MKKITTMLLSFLAVGALAGCGTEERDPVADQQTVDTVLTLAIASLNGTQPLTPDGEAVKLYADDGKTITIANSWVRDGETVAISWATNSATAFTFEDIDENSQRAIPVYPAFGEAAKGVSLTATATLGEASGTATFVFYLYPPAEVFTRSDLATIRTDKKAKDRVWVEGFVYALMENDWNMVFIADGQFGIALYHLDLSGHQTVNDTINGGKRALEVGDYVKAIGKYSPYNGLAEVGFLETVEIIAVPDYATEPSTKLLTETDFLSATGLLGRDAAKVKVEGLVFNGKYLDKDGLVVEGLDTTGAAHRDVVFMLGETEVKLNISYHVGSAKQIALQSFLNGLTAGQTVTFEGPLGWYNTPNLAYTDISQLTAVSA